MEGTALTTRPMMAAAGAQTLTAGRRLWWLGCATVALAFAFAFSAPVQLSLVAVSLFGGLHNWFEVRFLLSRMPPRWGRQRRYYLLAIGGTALLAGLFMALPFWGAAGRWTTQSWTEAIAGWTSLLILWSAALLWMRGKQKGRDWNFVWGAAFMLVGLTWLHPLAWDMALVYGHPLLALAFFRRLVARRRPELLSVARRLTLLALGATLLLAALLWQAPNLAGEDALTLRIAHHAGAGLMPELSTHLLVALHTFVQALHYAIWLVAMPWLTRGLPWRIGRLALLQGQSRWRPPVIALIALGALAVVALWVGFSLDYAATRDFYFVLAIIHVLAEIPFFIRTL